MMQIFILIKNLSGNFLIPNVYLNVLNLFPEKTEDTKRNI